MRFKKGSLQNIFGWVTAGFLFLLPLLSSNNLFYGSINTKFFLIVFLVDLLLILAAYHLYKREEVIVFRNQWLLYALGILILVQFISAFLSDFPGRAFWSDIRRSSGVLFLSHIALFSILLGNFFKERDWFLVRRAIAVSSGLFGLVTILGPGGLNFFQKFLWIDFSQDGITFGNSTFAGVYLLLALTFTFIELVHSYKEKKWRWVLICSLIFVVLSPIMFNTSILTGKTPLTDVFNNPLSILGLTRASSATMFILLGYLAFCFILRFMRSDRWKLRLRVIWSTSVLLSIVLAITLLFIPGSFIQNIYVETSTAARILLWESGFSAFLERPLFGWGPEHFDNAFAKYFNNDLYLKENVGQIWFDRAHNIFVDTLVTLGVTGFLAAFFFIISFLLVAYRSYRLRIIKGPEALLFTAFVPLHLLQLQTAFDTIASYTLIGVVIGYGIWCEKQISLKSITVSSGKNLALAIAFIIVALISMKFMIFDENNRQIALTKAFQTENFNEQQKLIERSLSRTSDLEGLRLSARSFIKGVVESDLETANQKIFKERINLIASLYDDAYSKYLDSYPNHYRARINYAYFMLIEGTLGKNRIAEAKKLLEDSYILSPNNPLTYSIHAIAEFYDGNVEVARKRADEAVRLNQEIVPAKIIHEYIIEQEKTMPSISFLHIENL